MWKKIHVTVSEEDYLSLKKIVPERGAFQHLMRRFIRTLIAMPGADSVTVKLKFSVTEEEEDYELDD